jgi:hypothetical protein
MTDISPHLLSLARKIAAAADAAGIMGAIRDFSGILSWKDADLFLYSPDLCGFHFPPGTRGGPAVSLRDAFLKIAPGGTEIEFPEDPLPWEEAMAKEAGVPVRLQPVMTGGGPGGFAAFAGGDAPIIPGEAELAAAVAGPVLELGRMALEMERVRLEAEIIKGDMASGEAGRLLGELTGGITHDFNNVLTGITGFTQLIEMMEDDPDKLDSLSEILTAAGNGRDIVNFLSSTKKARLEGEKTIYCLKSLASDGAQIASSILVQLAPGAHRTSFFEITGDEAQGEVNPILCRSLFIQAFTAMIRAGAEGISISVSQGDGSPRVKIQFKGTPPQDGQTVEGFAGGDSSFAAMARSLGFLVEASPGEMTLCLDGERRGRRFGTAPAGTRILVYEPDGRVRRLFEIFLGRWGAEAEFADSPADAGVRLSRSAPAFSALVLDASAIGVIDLPSTGRPRLVATCGLGGFARLDRLSFGPADRILMKPFDLGELAQAVGSVVSG